MAQWSKLLIASALISGVLTGCSSTDELIKIAPVPEIQSQVELKVSWDASLGGTGDYFTRLQPAVGYGKAFASDRDGQVAAFDALTGKQIWQVELNPSAGFFSSKESAQLSGGIAFGYDKIALGSESGELYVLEQETGKLMWQKQVGGEILAKPLMTNNMIIVSTGNGKIISFDIDSGEQGWVYQNDVPALSLRGSSGAVENQGAIFFGLPKGKIGGVLAEGGRAIWEQAIVTSQGANELANVIDVDATPVILGGTLYAIAYNGNLAALELRTGKVLWKRAYSSFQSIVIDGFNLYVTTSQGHVYAIDRRSGLEKWGQLGLENRQLTAPALIGGHVAVIDFEGYLHLLDAEQGNFVGQLQLDDDGYIAKPVVDHDMLYLLSKDGLLSAVSIK